MQEQIFFYLSWMVLNYIQVFEVSIWLPDWSEPIR